MQEDQRAMPKSEELSLLRISLWSDTQGWSFQDDTRQVSDIQQVDSEKQSHAEK